MSGGHADRTRTDAGFVAGGEAIALGVLVLVVGSLLVLGAWSVVDARLAVDAAAREAGRSLVESATARTDARDADRIATEVAIATLAAHHGPLSATDATWTHVDTHVTGALVRCGRVRTEVVVAVRTVRLPLVGGLGTVRLRGDHVERIEPYRSGLPVPSGGVRC